MSATEAFHFETLAPPLPIADLAEAVWVARGTIDYGRERILPTANPVLLVNLGSPFRVQASRRPDGDGHRTAGWLVGPQTSYVVNEPLAETDVVGVTLRPWGPTLLFDVAGHELRDRIIDLGLLWGPDLARLRERLHEQPRASVRMAILCRALAARRTVGLPQQVDYAARHLAQGSSGGIAAMTAELDISRKHLSALFGRYVGLPPGAFARVHRFNRALQTLGSTAPPPLADIALQHGYFDQAHMNRDFAAFGDVTPTEYLRRRHLHMTVDGDASGLFVPGL